MTISESQLFLGGTLFLGALTVLNAVDNRRYDAAATEVVTRTAQDRVSADPTLQHMQKIGAPYVVHSLFGKDPMTLLSVMAKPNKDGSFYLTSDSKDMRLFHRMTTIKNFRPQNTRKAQARQGSPMGTG